MMWTRLWSALRRGGDAGVTAVEYGIIIAGVGLAIITGVFLLRDSLSNSFQDTLENDAVTLPCAEPCDPYAGMPDSVVPDSPVLAIFGYSNISATRNVAITSQVPTVVNAFGTRTFTIAPNLTTDTGLSFSGTTGSITGTPTALLTPTTYTVTVRDGNGSTASTTLLVSVSGPALAFQTGYTSTTAVRGQSVSIGPPTVINACGGCAVTYTSSALPNGLSIASTTGVISGTPTAAQSATSYTVFANDGTNTATTTVSITVTGLSVSGYTTISATRGTAITTQTPTVTGFIGTRTFAISPNLTTNTGLSFNTSTGAISGTPTTASVATNYTVTVTDTGDGANTATTSVSVGVTGLSVSGYSSITATSGVAITTQTPTVTGFIGTRTFAISPNLTTNTGLSFSTSTGAISGTPTTASAATNYTVTVTDTGGGANTATTSVSVTVGAALPGACTPFNVGTTGSMTSGQIRLNWGAASGNGTAVTGYTIQYKLPAAGSWTTWGSVGAGVTSQTITLTANTLYDFQIVATNGGGSAVCAPTSGTVSGTTKS